MRWKKSSNKDSNSRWANFRSDISRLNSTWTSTRTQTSSITNTTSTLRICKTHTMMMSVDCRRKFQATMKTTTITRNKTLHPSISRNLPCSQMAKVWCQHPSMGDKSKCPRRKWSTLLPVTSPNSPNLWKGFMARWHSRRVTKSFRIIKTWCTRTAMEKTSSQRYWCLFSRIHFRPKVSLTSSPPTSSSKTWTSASDQHKLQTIFPLGVLGFWGFGALWRDGIREGLQNRSG